MAFKFNPFTGNFDDVADVAEKVESSSPSTTDNAVVRWDGTDGLSAQNSGVTIDDSDNVIIPGDLTVNGTTTTVNSATLDVTDANITVNNGGNDASAEGAGLTIQRVGIDGSLVYEDALASKFKIGAIGAEVEVADISSTQTLTNKTIDADNNTILDIANANISTTAAIEVSKLEALTANRAIFTNGSGVLTVSSVTDTELGHLTGVTSNIQTQINNISSSVQAIYDVQSSASGTINAVSGVTYLVDTSTTSRSVVLPAAASDAFVRIKDSSGNAEALPIVINPPGSETIDGASAVVMNSDFESLNIVSDGTNWFVL